MDIVIPAVIGLLLAGLIKGLLHYIENDVEEDESVKNDREDLLEEEPDWEFEDDSDVVDVDDLDPDLDI